MSKNSILASIRLPSSPTDWLRYSLAAVVVGLVYYAYWVQDVGLQMTAYRWLVGHWSHVSNYSHGPLIPFIALGLVWWKRNELLAQSIKPLNWGFAVIGLAMVVYYVGNKAMEARIVVISFVFLLYGLVLTLAGIKVFRVLFFPITFLLLMVPLNFLEEAVGFPLRMFVAKSATLALNWLGIDAVRRGSGILSAVFQFDVADPCSGIRSLMALTTVTAAYAYVTQHVQWKRWLLFASAMPLAVLGNLARVVSIALVAQVYGQDLATKVYHDWSGYIVFPVALSAMVILGLLLNFNYRATLEKWMRPPEPSKSDE